MHGGSGVRTGNGAAGDAGRHDERVDVIGRRPMDHHRDCHYAGGRQRPQRGIGAPGDIDRKRSEDGEDRERRRIMPAGDGEHGRGQQIGGDGGGGDSIGLSGRVAGAVEQAAHDQHGRQRKADNHVEQMRRQRFHVRMVDAGQRPERAQHNGGDREPAPQPHARQRKGGGGDDGEIEVKRPIARVIRGHQQRRDEGAGKPEAGERGPMQ